MKRFSLILTFILLAFFGGALQAQDEPEKPAPGSIYLEMSPSFVLNYGEGNRLKYIRTDITLRLSTEGSIIANVNMHMPKLRHTVVMFLSKQTDERINDPMQREELRQELLNELRGAMDEEVSSIGLLDLLFVTFIVQQ